MSAVIVGTGRAEVVGGSLPGGCDVENNYGLSMAVLRSGHLAVGSSGEFCGWVDVLDAAGTSVASLLDPDDTTFGLVVAAIGDDVLVGSRLSGRVLRIEPGTATVRTQYELPDGFLGFPTAIAAVGRQVAVLVSRYDKPQVVYLFDARTGALRRTIPNPDPEHDLHPLLVRFGRRLVVADTGGTVRLLNPKTGAVRLSLHGDGLGAAIAADDKVMAVSGPGPSAGSGAVHLFDRRGRLLRTVQQEPDGAECFGAAVAMLDDALLVGAPCTTVLDWFEGTAYLYSATSGKLLAHFEGRGVEERLGSSVALLPAAVALGGRGPDTADNGIVRIVPR